MRRPSNNPPIPVGDHSRTEFADRQTPGGPKPVHQEAPLASDELRAKLLAQEPRAMERRAPKLVRRIELPTVTVVGWLDEFWNENKQRWADQPYPPTPRQIVAEAQAALAARALDSI